MIGDIRQIYPMPDEKNYNQAKIVREYQRVKANGKTVFKIGGITSASYIDIGEVSKIYSFGAPEKRISQDIEVSNGKEKYTRTYWSVLKTPEGKYIPDNYFVSRVIQYYAKIKGLSYAEIYYSIKRVTGKDLIGILIEIRKAIENKSPKVFDKYGVPKVSKTWINRMIQYLQEEFDLTIPIKLVRDTHRLLTTKKTADQYLKELEEQKKVKIDEYTDQEEW